MKHPTQSSPGGPETEPPLGLALREDVALVEQGEDLVLNGRTVRLTLRAPAPGRRAALRALCAPCGAAPEVLEEMAAEDGTDGLAIWFYDLERFARLNLLRHLVRDGDGPILSAWGMAQMALAEIGELVDKARYRLSRFAYLRAVDGRFLVETPLAATRIAVHDTRVGMLLAALAAPRTLAEAIHAAGGLSAPAVAACLRLLAACSVIARETGAGLEEERDAVLRQWQFHDLLFHARSRLGRHDDGFGGTFRFLDVIPPVPAVATGAAEAWLALPRPDLAACAADDPPLTAVMRARRSLRRHGAQPITLDQLGAFLFRVARIDQLIPPDPGRRRFYETSRRPYPSGGAVYELELYLVVDRCAGLAPGLYHYDALDHRLGRISGPTEATESLIEGARLATKEPGRPQILITLASRFQRVSWKYETIAYAATLKNVGVLYQTMYLVATAMGLAPCALGGGNTDLFARATGRDYLVETAVGEFMLGSRES